MEECLTSWGRARPRAAYFYALLAYSMLAAYQAIAKALYVLVDPFSLFIYRSIALLILNTLLLRAQGQQPYLSRLTST